MPSSDFELNLIESLKPYKSALLLHIPHSKVFIPEWGSYFDKDKARQEAFIYCDTDTDAIFDIEGVERVVFPYSRVYSDVERFADDREELNKIGRGFYYTHDGQGNVFRNSKDLHNSLKAYVEHHDNFTNKVREILRKENEVLIIDCHSFDERSIGVNGNTNIDICIGVDDFHTTSYIQDHLVSYFITQGFSVQVNKPFSGSIVPEVFYKKDARVKSVMIELNKNIYQGQPIAKWKELINKAIQPLYRE